MAKLIIFLGDLASGKSTLAHRVGKSLGIPCFCKDRIKEYLADDIGFTNRVENKKLSNASTSLMSYFMDEFGLVKESMIVETNFHATELNNLTVKAQEYGYDVIIFNMTADIKLLHERFMDRINKYGRHFAHTSIDLSKLEDFKKVVLSAREETTLYDAYHIDTTGENWDSYLVYALEKVGGK